MVGVRHLPSGQSCALLGAWARRAPRLHCALWNLTVLFSASG